MIWIACIYPRVVAFLCVDNECDKPQSQHIFAEVSIPRFEDVILPAVGHSDTEIHAGNTAIRIASRLRKQERPETLCEVSRSLPRRGQVTERISGKSILIDEPGDDVIDQVAAHVPTPGDLPDPDRSAIGIRAGRVVCPVCCSNARRTDSRNDVVGLDPESPVEIVVKVEEGLIPQKVLSPPDRDQRLQTEAHQGYDGPGCQGSLDDQL